MMEGSESLGWDAIACCFALRCQGDVKLRLTLGYLSLVSY